MHKQGRRHEVGPILCFLWRILTWCARNQVTLKARHIPGQLSVVADKLSRLDQTTQTEWSLLQEVFQAICNRWHQPQIDLFATRFNKLPLFVSPVPDPWPQQWMRSVCHGRIRKHTPSHYQPYWASGDVAGLPIQENHSDCSGVAHHALVLGSSGHVQPNPTDPAQSAQPVDITIQSDPSQKSDILISMHGSWSLSIRGAGLR